MKTQNSAKPGDMNIDGDNQFRFIDRAPKPGINVVAANHPAKKEIQPFGCAALTGARQKKSKPFGFDALMCIRYLSKSESQNRDQGRNGIFVGGIKPKQKKFLDTAVFDKYAFRSKTSKSDISSPVLKRCLKSSNRCPVFIREIQHKIERASAHSTKQIIQIVFNLLDPPVSKAGGQKADYLHIRGIGISVNKLQRVGPN